MGESTPAATDIKYQRDRFVAFAFAVQYGQGYLFGKPGMGVAPTRQLATAGGR